MLNVVIYRPGSWYVNTNGKPQMAALVVTFIVDEESFESSRWIAQDDLGKITDRQWIREQVIAAFTEILDEILPVDIVCVQPTLQDELGEMDT